MVWKKLGKIFDPSNHEFFDDYIGFAQSPQVIIFDDYVRIYFSIRKETSNGEYLSYVQFIDMDKEFKHVIACSQGSVIKLGKLGTFDEHGIFPFNVLRHQNKIYGYTSGWSRRVSVSVETGIGLAISDDNGLTFNKIGDGPILTSSLTEPYLVVDGFVKVYDGIFHMWYIYGTDWKSYSGETAPERTYKIGHATSVDGIQWKKDEKQLIKDKQDDECQALPTVIKIGKNYHMFFAYRNSFDFRSNKDNSYRIGYAYSDDLVYWIRDDAQVGIDVADEGWDSEMMTYPHVFECQNSIYMLYNGNAFGRYGFGLAKLESLI